MKKEFKKYRKLFDIYGELSENITKKIKSFDLNKRDELNLVLNIQKLGKVAVDMTTEYDNVWEKITMKKIVQKIFKDIEKWWEEGDFSLSSLRKLKKKWGVK